MLKNMLKFFLSLILIFATLKCGNFLKLASSNPTRSLASIKAIKKVLPIDKSSGVDRFANIVVYFQDKMDPASITNQTFLIRDSQFNYIQGTVTYNEEFKIARFQTSEALLAKTAYTATLSDAVKDSQGKSIAGQYVWTFKTGENLQPALLSIGSTYPASGETEVPLNSIVTIKANMELDPTSVTSSTFKVSSAESVIEGTLRYEALVATFVPSSNLKPNTEYLVTISSIFCSNGHTLASDYIWTFTTGSSAHAGDFALNKREPVENSSSVSRSTLIKATFSESIDATTVTPSTFYVTGPSGTKLDGLIFVQDTVLTFTPKIELSSNTVYTVVLTDGIKSIHSQSLPSSASWTFQTLSTSDTTRPTVTLTSPSNNETSVKLLPRITANFSKMMDPNTISVSSFLLRDSSQNLVEGTVSVLGSAAFFTPTSPLTHNTNYTASLLAEIKDINGNPLSSLHSWDFTTHIYPVPISSDPTNGATDVPIDGAIHVKFSEAMDPVSINASSFQLLGPGNSVVSGAISNAGETTTLTPSSSLAGNTSYQIKLSTDVKDLDGVRLQLNFSSQFKTKHVVSSQLAYYTINDGSSIFRSSTPFSKGRQGGTFSNSTNSDGSVTLTIVSAPNEVDSGFYIIVGALSSFNGFTVETTGSPVTAKIWFDKNNDSEFFTWTGSKYSSIGSDAYILGTSMNAGSNTVDASTTFNSLTPGGGSYTLAQLQSGAAAGISGTTRIAIWVGIVVSSGSATATVKNLSLK